MTGQEDEVDRAMENRILEAGRRAEKEYKPWMSTAAALLEDSI